MKEIQDLLQKADRFIKSAHLLINDQDYDSTASRCYYAMFLTTQALLMTKNLRPKSHVGTFQQFGQHFLKTSEIDRKYGRMLNEAFDLRQIGDYSSGCV